MLMSATYNVKPFSKENQVKKKKSGLLSIILEAKEDI